MADRAQPADGRSTEPSPDLPGPPAASLRVRGAVALVLVIVSFSLSLPGVLSGGLLTPDGTEHVAIGLSWVSGSGFVDPVLIHYYLDDPIPIAGHAVRPPLVSMLLSIPLGLGASLVALNTLHALFAAMVVQASSVSVPG